MSPDDTAADLHHAAAVLAVDPRLGVLLRGVPDPVRQGWLDRVRDLLPAGTPWRHLPPGIAADRLRGGLDLAASLRAGQAVAASGLLAEAAGGILVVVSAERLAPDIAALLVHGLEREAGPAGLVALDEGRDDEGVPPGLAEHLAIHIDLTACRTVGDPATAADSRRIAAARRRLRAVVVEPETIAALCGAALALGIGSLRAPLQAVRVARAAAALAGRSSVGPDEVALACRLCLGPRARVVPSADTANPEPGETADPSSTFQAERTGPPRDGGEGSATLESIAIAAARAALPALLNLPQTAGVAGRSAGGAPRSAGRGRPTAASVGRSVGARPGRPAQSSDLALVATLQAAAPWQRLRGRQAGGGLRLRPDDLRVVRRRTPHRTTTIFAVDASGSAAHGRLAEAKGAVELLLAECYVRRDEVALVAFRGSAADLLLPPTRALARARRELADLPGGGGTPLAAGLDLALAVARKARWDGRNAVVAVLTDGRANVGRDGTRVRAEADGLEGAAAICAAGLRALVIDVGARPGPAARRLAEAMGARYVPLPHADAATIAGALEAERAAS